MAYVDGYKIKMSDGTTVNLIPQGKKETELTIGPLTATVTKVRGKVRVSLSFFLTDKGIDLSIASVAKARIQKPTKFDESKEEQTAAGAPQRCGICQGRRYCIRNGCINIGCGWICSIEP